METVRLDALRSQIESAFDHAHPPAEDRIGYNPDDWESAELSQAFKGRHWKDLSLAELQYHSISFTSSEGFRYYLPAYLMGALADYGNLMPHTVYGLTLPEGTSSQDEKLRHWQLERFDGLSSAQKHAVRCFLEYARDEASSYFTQGQAPSLALARYWGRF
ncbi:hypothetical protein CYFUS_008474 [Cystobacter fuscus]|uniref:Uncharacterized protein n=1 Tax=Cystobacter fuscus TaxID=43 RepID=A0A250JGH0_9BACT|nr:DUF6714 family protein [Cystobacter fuscus]ATB42995.1 hypothetical protein CYFUS_008474 [Cystobacter fuscus]